MRMAELSRASGVPVPTIKYYLREGLLRAGERTSPNQAQYDQSHLDRLVLIRALIEVGKLSIAQAKMILARLDEPGQQLFDIVGAAQAAIAGPTAQLDDDEFAAGDAVVSNLVMRHGWTVNPGNAGWRQLVEVLAVSRRLRLDDFADLLDSYAEAMDAISGDEISWAAAGAVSRDSVVERAVVGMVLGEVALAALRRMAEENASSKSFPE